METREIFERRDIIAHDRLLGYASVRYPVTDIKPVDRYYKGLAEAFIKRADRNKHTGILSCRVSYEDEAFISVITEARIYNEGECIRRHRSSFVWGKPKGRLCYIRKHGIRCSNIICTEGELSIFN